MFNILVFYNVHLHYSTVMNLGPPSQQLEDNNNTEQVVNEVAVAVAGSSEESRDDMPQSDNDTVSETTSSHPPKTGKKSKSRAQVEREELADKIINFASKEDHPIDLELAALCSKIKRKLPDPDDQDDLDEIKDVARAFFQRKKRAATNISIVQPVRQTPPPTPPPLQMFPQQQQQQEQGSGGMTSQYSTINYLTDGSSGATYMAL